MIKANVKGGNENNHQCTLSLLWYPSTVAPWGSGYQYEGNNLTKEHTKNLSIKQDGAQELLKWFYFW